MSCANLLQNWMDIQFSIKKMYMQLMCGQSKGKSDILTIGGAKNCHFKNSPLVDVYLYIHIYVHTIL